ncbi:MAG TPA: class I SAM-dependent methyltransferase [Gaiellaceae bacterium]|nr:class I SAM-dependent methyltransferase [Gaiellaceae bacterium]
MERDDWNHRWRERGFHCHDDPNDLLEAEVAPLPPGRALDLGCGSGRSTIWLVERGWHVTGVDFSDVALEAARKARPDVDWVLADVREYEPETGAFDLVLVLYIHLPHAERRSLLARAAGALAPGGTLLVAGHDLTNIGTGAPGPTNPDVLYTPEQIVLELPGLEAARAESVSRPVEDATAVDTIVVARKA